MLIRDMLAPRLGILAGAAITTTEIDGGAGRGRGTTIIATPPGVLAELVLLLLPVVQLVVVVAATVPLELVTVVPNNEGRADDVTNCKVEACCIVFRDGLFPDQRNRETRKSKR